MTVDSLMNSRSPISRLRRPSASSASTSRSRSLSCSSGSTAPLGRAADEVAQQPGCDRRSDPWLAVTRLEHRLDQLGGRHVLDQIARRADPQRGVEIGLLLGHGQHQHLGARQARADRSTRLDPGHDRHVEVEQDDVGAALLGERDRLAAVAREAHNLEPVVGAEQCGGALPHQPVVVGDEHPERRLGHRVDGLSSQVTVGTDHDVSGEFGPPGQRLPPEALAGLEALTRVARALVGSGNLTELAERALAAMRRCARARTRGPLSAEAGAAAQSAALRGVRRRNRKRPSPRPGLVRRRGLAPGGRERRAARLSGRRRAGW